MMLVNSIQQRGEVSGGQHSRAFYQVTGKACPRMVREAEGRPKSHVRRVRWGKDCKGTVSSSECRGDGRG